MCVGKRDYIRRGQAIVRKGCKTHEHKTIESALSVVICSDSVTLPKAGEYIVRGQVNIRGGIVGLFEPLKIECRIEDSLLGSGLVETDEKGRIPVRVWTFRDSVHLKKGTELGTLCVCQQGDGKEIICEIHCS